MIAEQTLRIRLMATALMLAAIGLGAVGQRLLRERTHANAAVAEQRLEAMLQQIAARREAGDYPAARTLLGTTLAETKSVFGAQSFAAATVLNQLGMLGKYDGNAKAPHQGDKGRA